jgi:aldehyde:ferredoxin oxidoreductase
MHVKGLELPMHDPRVKRGLGVIYSVEAHGADHCAGMHDTGFTQDSPGFEHLRGLGGTRPLPADDLSGEKVANQRATHLWNLFKDSAVACQFVPWSLQEHVDIIAASTGWSYTAHEALQLGERIATLGRIFNMREGIDAGKDELPKRFFTGTKSGGLINGGIPENEMEGAISQFYGMMGWDTDTGVPTSHVLAELGISWAAEHLPAEAVA